MTGERTALAFVNDVGFCSTFFVFPEGVPCLWEAVAGRARPPWPRHSHHDAAIGLTWSLKDTLPAKRLVYYGKLLKGRPLLVALDVVPAFALRPSQPEDVGRPAFRAPIDTGTAKPLEVNGQERLELAPGEKRTLVVGLEPLYWDHYESVLWPSRPLRRVVIPGRYDLVLEVQDADSGHFWRSNVVAAVVKKAGSLEIEKPD